MILIMTIMILMMTMKIIDFLHNTSHIHICLIAVLYISTGREHGCLTPQKDLSPWKTIK